MGRARGAMFVKPPRGAGNIANAPHASLSPAMSGPVPGKCDPVECDPGDATWRGWPAGARGCNRRDGTAPAGANKTRAGCGRCMRRAVVARVGTGRTFAPCNAMRWSRPCLVPIPILSDDYSDTGRTAERY
ncbi:hypothetical protein C3920_00865 [Novacetimonas pomaceti]|uniref:Uncharacterized protein n=1 Tax=Novacetimonas pomaceti TaxID=2021998 RepID=A0ABX5P6U8_9PROT|nr:hypothetical protein C3920_00865 [Novacetimonas pomaceti]